MSLSRFLVSRVVVGFQLLVSENNSEIKLAMALAISLLTQAIL